MSTYTNVQNEVKELTPIQLASGVALSLSGYHNLCDTVLVYSGVENGTLTISAGDYMNSKAKTQTITAGKVYGIADLNGSELEQNDNSITISGPSGTIYPIYLSR